MHINLLNETLVGIDARSKFFLIKYLQTYVVNGNVTASRTWLSLEFQINHRAVNKAMAHLLEKKYLREDKIRTGKRGRPRGMLLPGQALLDLFKKWATFQPIDHKSLIDELLHIPKLKNAKEDLSGTEQHHLNEDVLTNVRKLLLCILFSRADQYGIVRGLSMTKLASLVGLSTQQIRWHLKKLEGSKYFKSWVPGMAVKGIKGKPPSIFFMSLNSAHQYASQIDPSQKVIMFLHDSQIFNLLERAVHLAYAIKSIYGDLKSHATFVSMCESHYSHWASIYCFDEQLFKGVVASVDILTKIGDVNGPIFKRLCNLFCELVEACFEDNELDDKEEVQLEKYITEVIIKKAAKFQLKILTSGYRRQDLIRLQGVSRLVLSFYLEIKAHVEPFQGEGSKRIGISSIYLLPDKKRVSIQCVVKDDELGSEE